MQPPAGQVEHGAALVFGRHRIRVGSLSAGDRGDSGRMTMTRRRLVVIAALLTLAGLVYYFYGGSQTPAGQRPLVSVNPENFQQLQREFNDANGAVRVITLLSPT